MNTRKQYNLYWVATDDHDEDWFVVAEDEFLAMDFFENYEGYDPGDAWAEKVMPIPDHMSCKRGWPGQRLPV